MKMHDKAFYLKANRKEDFAIKNLSRWIDAAYLMKADCYIICDDEDLIREINSRLLIYYPVIFLKSEKCNELEFIVNNIGNRNWINAAYAHLTSFYSARELQYRYFWNIDADDTRFCTSLDKMVEILSLVEKYTEDNDLDCISLDMWRSETLGKHWSFGVTYVNGKRDWIRLCSEKCRDEKYSFMETEGNKNVDWFFTYLKSETNWRIETFYVENLRFIHYSNDLIEKPVGSGIYHWKDGKLTYPLVYYCFGISDLGKYDIADDVIKIDANVTDREAENFLMYYAREGKDLNQYYDVESFLNLHTCKLKFNEFKKRHGFSEQDNPEIICFGAGNALEKNIKKLKKIYDVKYVCDNAQEKWEKIIVDDIKCISPQTLAACRNVIVVIFVYSKNCIKQIAAQLDDMKVKYDTMDNLFLCIE